MAAFTARPYQLKIEADARDAFAAGHRAVMVTSPVASGKTVMFSRIAAGVHAKSKRVLILAHRRELIFQISNTLTAMRVPHGTLLGGQPGLPRKNVVVGAVQTVFKRLPFMQAPDLIICDEAHRCTDESSFGQVISHFAQARVLGVSASPRRTDMRPLDSIFDTLVHGPSVAELIALGYLPPPEVYAPAKPDLSQVHVRRGDFVASESESAMDKPHVTGTALQHYRKLADGKRAIIFCVSIAHAQHVAAEFAAAGYSAAHVDGRMNDGERASRLKAFESGRVPILTTVDLCNEGLDIPGIEAAILLRPTMSLIVHVQQMGRAMRPAPGKTRALIIDACGNVHRHGLPDEPREWSLDGIMQQPRESVPRVSTCPKCYACYSPGLSECPRCGYVKAAVGRKVEHRDGELERVGDGSEYETPDTGDTLKDMEKQYAILRSVGRQRGYAQPEAWAFRVVSARLADKLARQKQDSAGPLGELEMRTIRRDTVERAMSGEET